MNPNSRPLSLVAAFVASVGLVACAAAFPAYPFGETTTGSGGSTSGVTGTGGKAEGGGGAGVGGGSPATGGAGGMGGSQVSGTGGSTTVSTTSTTGSGGQGGASTTATSTTSGAGGAGGGPLGCSHDPCLMGSPLEDGCDPCVVTVCASATTCCLSAWNISCASDAQTLCGLQCGKTDSCAHSPCVVGGALDGDHEHACSLPVYRVCNPGDGAMPECCSVGWSAACVTAAKGWGQVCP